MAPGARLSLGLLLTACAGFIDAVGFIQLGGYYTSFMSGNTTQLGISVLDAGQFLLPLSLVAMFFLGSFAGSALALRSAMYGSRLVLLLVIATLGTSLALSLSGFPSSQAMLLLAAGAGAQNAVFTFSGGARLGTTFVTGTLFGAGQDLAAALNGQAPKWRWLQHLSVWAALLLGALAGALTYAGIGVLAILVPGFVYFGMLAWFSLSRP